MSVLIMCLLAVPAGVLLDAWIARLAREPYLHDADADDDAAPTLKGEAAAVGAAPLADEANMPRALTSAAWYRRVAVVAATVALFALLGWRYDADALHLAIAAAYVSVLIVCTGTDMLAYRVPNIVTYPAILAAITVGMVVPGASVADVWAGGLIIGGTFLVMSIATRGGMGLGDVKLALFVGFALGLGLGIMSLLITAIAGGVIAVLLMLTGLRSRRDPIPYAPFIAMGALFVILVHGTAFTAL
jgi:prepilin signal peptidase PulO-like enzyme (type II secretory pathway)